MTSFWTNLQPRERRMLLGGAVALLLLGLYGLVWEPYREAVERTSAGIEAKRTTLAWMRGAARQVERLRSSSGGRQPGPAGQSLLALVDGTARSHGLGEALKRVQPDGQSAVRVWLEDAPFDASLSWMGELHRDRGLNIDDLVVERAGSTGHANVRLVFQEGPA